MRRYVIWNRHGHRAPGKNIFPGSIKSEKALWQRLVVPEVQHASLARKHRITSEYDKGRDMHTFPFGNLTVKGATHLERVGQQLFKQFGSDFKQLNENSCVKLYCTNYSRTQCSAQSLLSGMRFGSMYYQNMDHELFVRAMERCPMAFYEGRQPLASSMSKRIQQNDEFKELEASFADIREKILSVFPNLMVDPFTAQFDYLAAFDYFVCREAHSLPIDAAFSSDGINYTTVLTTHMCARYGHYLNDEQHLAEFAGPLVADLVQQIDASLHNDNTHFTLFSGHDVNLLALLYGLDLVKDGLWHAYWPGYGSTCVFQIEPEAAENDAKVHVYIDLEVAPRCTFSLLQLKDIKARLADKYTWDHH